MKISNIPFALVFASLFFPLLSAIYDSYFVTLIIDIVTFLLFFFILISKKNLNIEKNYLIFIILPIILNNFFMIIIGNGIGNKSLIGLNSTCISTG